MKPHYFVVDANEVDTYLAGGSELHGSAIVVGSSVKQPMLSDLPKSAAKTAGLEAQKPKAAPAPAAKAESTKKEDAKKDK